MSRWRAAIDQALLLQQNPGLAEEFKRNALPDGMATLIRLVSDEGGRRRDLAVMLGIDEGVLQAAAIGYIQIVCLYPGSAEARSLGLNSANDLKAAKEHHRLLLKWLHPDRNPDHRELAERVNRSWSTIKKGNQDHDPAASLAAVDPDYREVAPMPASGRFPLFLWGVAGLSVLLLILSLLPDAEIYVGSDETAQESLLDGTRSASIPEPLDPEDESRIDALKASFEAPEPAVAAKSAAMPESTAVSTRPIPEVKPANAKAVTNSLATMPAVGAKSSVVPAPVPKVPAQSAPTASAKSVPAVSNPVAAVKPAKPVVAEAAVPEMQQAPAQAVAVAAAEQPAINLTTAGQALMLEFRRSYGAGQINPFMALFTANARNERGGRQAIYEDYAKFFESSSSRKINFSNIDCRPASRRITCSADYAASVKRKGKLLPETVKGRIELQMSSVDDRLLIDRIRIGA
jgi:hypothetical protein